MRLWGQGQALWLGHLSLHQDTLHLTLTVPTGQQPAAPTHLAYEESPRPRMAKSI